MVHMLINRQGRAGHIFISWVETLGEFHDFLYMYICPLAAIKQLKMMAFSVTDDPNRLSGSVAT